MCSVPKPHQPPHGASFGILMFAYQKEKHNWLFKNFHFFPFIWKPQKHEVPCEPHCSRHEDDGVHQMDVISTMTLLQEMGILPLGIACNTCLTILGPYTTNHNYHYFECNSCKTKTSILNHTVLSNSNTKLRTVVSHMGGRVFSGQFFLHFFYLYGLLLYTWCGKKCLECIRSLIMLSKLVALEAYEAILHCKFEYSTKLTPHRSAPVLCHF